MGSFANNVIMLLQILDSLTFFFLTESKYLMQTFKDRLVYYDIRFV